MIAINVRAFAYRVAVGSVSVLGRTHADVAENAPQNAPQVRLTAADAFVAPVIRRFAEVFFDAEELVVLRDAL